jgi:glycosyltransferase involved in cell wall biosynthesis
MRVALIHDWLTGMRGGEKVLAAIAELYPQADLFTLIHLRGNCEPIVRGRRVITSFLNDLPGVRSYYRHLLPLMPMAIERFDLSGYELIISSSHCVAKGIRRPEGALHLCYCHTPARYLWTQTQQYTTRSSRLTRMGLAAFKPYLQRWDRHSAAQVNRFIANSQNVARRIQKIYQRESTVIYPPVDTDFFIPAADQREDYYLVTSALVPYKCVDHAVEAFKRLQLPLRVIGSGPMMASLARGAPAHVQFLGWQSDEAVREHYRRCRALILPGEEDFGLTPLEAMACGTPVIAYGAGGAMETVTANPRTGLLYQPHTVEALMETVLAFQSRRNEFSPTQLRAWAERFGKQIFHRNFGGAVNEELATWEQAKS